MTYRYEFDTSRVGDLRLSNERYRILHESYKLMRSKLAEWNKKALKHGASRPPYEKEQADCDRMIEWGEQRLEVQDNIYGDIAVTGISVGSLRYCKAALLLLIYHKEKEIEERRSEGWPAGALQSLEEGLDQIRKVEQLFHHPPADILWELIPRSASEGSDVSVADWDVFISHAYEDKEGFVRLLAEGLRTKGLRVWFDEFTLRVGDSLRRSIDRGLASSRYGIVVVSPYFLSKEWPQKELDGLTALESKGRKVILPVWHNISSEEIKRHSPMLADRFAVSSDSGLETVIDALLEAMGEKRDVQKAPG